ncbi:hypothetical protein MYX82_02840 [Acidobacteria bacterium AH-259-D05]|nr:hypothetical protein [Acidobacteria bacterium AH-259-D05]
MAGGSVTAPPAPIPPPLVLVPGFNPTVRFCSWINSPSHYKVIEKIGQGGMGEGGDPDIHTSSFNVASGDPNVFELTCGPFNRSH